MDRLDFILAVVSSAVANKSQYNSKAKSQN